MCGADFKRLEEFNTTIAPLISNLTKESSKTVNEKSAGIARTLHYYRDVLRISSSKPNLTSRQKSLLELYSYLVVAEGIFSETLQVIAFILLQNHHDIYDAERREFVRNYEELNNLSLREKMQFVEMHGFKFVSGACDRDLRNSIAHLRTIVNEDGSIVEITRKGETGKVIKDLYEKTRYLIGVCTLTVVEVRRLVGKHLEAESKKE